MIRSCVILTFILVFFATSGFSQITAHTKPDPNAFLLDLLNVPAPPPPPIASAESKDVERPREFFFESKIPKDDAPIEDILDYWAQHNSQFDIYRHNFKPSENVLRRILEACKKDPTKFRNYLSFFPPNSEYSEAVLQAFLNKSAMTGSYQDRELREWLKRNTNHFKNELKREGVLIKENGDYIRFQGPLGDLAKVDWEAALPILEGQLNNLENGALRIFAMWMFYRHAIQTGDSAETENYREQLKSIVANRNTPFPQRDLAMDALATSGPWDGRVDWYLSLLEDESLLTLQDNRYTGLTTLIMNDRSVNWSEIMLRLISSPNFAVRSAAARNLMRLYADDNTEILKALLPWLSNPLWAKESGDLERNQLIKALAEIEVPEASEGLAWVIANEKPSENPFDQQDSENTNEFRVLANQRAAVLAMIRYKYPLAIPALKTLLTKTQSNDDRFLVITALQSCGGYSAAEQVEAIEAYATELPKSNDGGKFISNGNFESFTVAEAENVQDARPPDKILLARVLIEQEEVTDEFVAALFVRLKILRRTNPELATTVYQIMQKWQSRVVDLEMISRLQEGKIDAAMIVNMLGRRAKISKRIPEELSTILSRNGAARGIASVLRDDPDTRLAILRGDDIVAKIALLACARLVRAQLPPAEVNSLINSPNALLATAAERYLESEDSAESRAYIYAKHRNEALILGARDAFSPKQNFAVETDLMQQLFASINDGVYVEAEYEELNKIEDALRKEVLANDSLIGIYGFVNMGAPDYRVVRIFKNQVVLTWYEDPARYREYTVSEEDFARIRELISREKIDDFPPDRSSEGSDGANSHELLFIGRGGGRRIFIPNPESAYEPIRELYRAFLKISSGENFKIYYHLSASVKGLTVHHSNDRKYAMTLWKNGNDFRVLFADKEKQSLLQERFEREIEEQRKRDLEALQNDVDEDSTLTKDPRALTSAELAMRAAANAAASSGSSARTAERAKLLTDLMKAENKMRLRIEERNSSHLGWRAFLEGKIGDEVPQPDQVPFLKRTNDSGRSITSPNEFLNSRAGDVQVTANYRGVFKKVGDSEPIVVKQGWYRNSVISSDAKWIVVTKQNEETGKQILVRINLGTGRETPIASKLSENMIPIAYIPAHNKVLLAKESVGNVSNSGETSAPVAFSREDFVDGDSTFQLGTRVESAALNETYLKSLTFYFVDPVSGLISRAQGDFRPFYRVSFRSLQPTANASEYWAAIPSPDATEIGRYDLKTLRFNVILKIPKISFKSEDLWVDEAEQRAYFVYKGHILSLPLGKPQ